MKPHTGLAVLLFLIVSACAGNTADDPGVLLDVETFPEQSVGVHLSEEAVRQITNGELEPPDYNSDPPTSGPHAARAAACGIFRQPVPDVYQIQDLAIGVVVIQYSPSLEDAEVERIENLARSLEDRVIVAPRPGMPASVVATAWTTMMRLDDGVDEAALRAFYDAYVGGGPESGPCPFDVDEGA
jgi:hypothetical protein